VDALQARGHRVAGLARSADAEAKLTAAGAKVVRGELKDPNALRETAADSDAVIHTANTNDTEAAQADDAAVSNIIAGLKTTNRPFIYTSGIWVNGNTGGTTIDEDAPYNPLPLVSWRPAHEQRVLKAAEDRVRGIVIRPGIVYGRGGGIIGLLRQWAHQRRAVRIVGDGENYWPFVHVDDLAELYVLSLENAPARTILFGVSDDPVQLNDIATAMANGPKLNGKIEHWPIEEARKELGGFTDGLAADQKVTGRRAMDLLGWRPSRPSVLEEIRTGSYARG
jgi:nucleoside-diphosphate-sugar epimerase